MNTRPPITCQIDDKHVPLYNIVWIAETPHFCGEEDCTAEGMYEIRLTQGESLFGTRDDRDDALVALGIWRGGGAEGEW
jgi:hypothetical protein